MAWSDAEVSELYLRASRARAAALAAELSARRILPRLRTHRLVLDRAYPSSPASVALARAEIAGYAAWCGATDEQLYAVRLAVSEAVTNTVVHAYPKGGGVIYLTATRIADELTVMVADDGVGPRRASANSRLAVGWSIIADAADQFTVTARGGGGTLVEMRWAMVGPVAAIAPNLLDAEEAPAARDPGEPAPTDLRAVRERRKRSHRP